MSFIKQFNMTFLENDEISKPEICDIITPTTVYHMSKEHRESMINKLGSRSSICLNMF